MICRLLLITVFTGLLTPVMHAESRADRPWTLTGYWENDGGPLKPNNNQDRHYTNGLAFTLSHQPKWATDLAPYVPLSGAFDGQDTAYAAGYAVGQLIFTPDNINLLIPPPDDRPYAGYLYAGVYWQRSDENTFDHLQFDLGMVGPSSLAEDVQDGVHDLVDGIDPQGWDSQIRDEPTFQFHARRKWRMWLIAPDGFIIDHPEPNARRGLGAEFIPAVGTALGTVYVNAELGVVARVGWNLPDDFGPGRLADYVDATGSQRGERWFAYFYGRSTARFIAHDIFLDAGLFEDNPGLGVDKRNVVGEFQLGVAVGVQWRNVTFTGGYAQTFSTETFEGQYTGDEWGALTLGLTIWQ